MTSVAPHRRQVSTPSLGPKDRPEVHKLIREALIDSLDFDDADADLIAAAAARYAVKKRIDSGSRGRGRPDQWDELRRLLLLRMWGHLRGRSPQLTFEAFARIAVRAEGHPQPLPEFWGLTLSTSTLERQLRKALREFRHRHSTGNTAIEDLAEACFPL